MQPNDIISILGWIVAALLGIPAAFYYGRRVIKSRALEKVENIKQLRETLAVIILAQVSAEEYQPHEFASYSLSWFHMRPWLKKGMRDNLLIVQRLAKDFEFWLDLSKDLVSATVTKAAYYDGTYSEFSQKMDHTGHGHFHELLSQHFRLHILNGQDITIPWVRDNCSDFYSEMMSMGSRVDIVKVLEPIRAVAKNQCLQIMREKRQEFLKVARQTVIDMQLIAGEH
jgi:hypothetical protein